MEPHAAHHVTVNNEENVMQTQIANNSSPSTRWNRLMKARFAATAGLLLQACASTGFDRNVDVSEEAQFDDYKTFAWLTTEPLTRSGTPSAINSPVLEPQIRQAVEAELAAKGYKQVSRGQADLVVAVRTHSQDKVRIRNYYDNFGYYYGGFNRGFSRFGRFGRFNSFGPGFGRGFGNTTVARTITEGSLIVDFFDNRSKQAIWHGSATKSIRSKDSVPEYIDQAAMELLDAFPTVEKMDAVVKEMMS